jgi:hypothetical protein
MKILFFIFAAAAFVYPKCAQDSQQSLPSEKARRYMRAKGALYAD